MKKLGFLSGLAALLLIGFATTNCNKKEAKAPQADSAGLHIDLTGHSTGGTTAGTTAGTTGYTKFGDLRVETYNSSGGHIGGVHVFLASTLDSAKKYQVYTLNGAVYKDTSGGGGTTFALLKNVPIRKKPFYIGAYQLSGSDTVKRGVPKSIDVNTLYSPSLPYMSDSIAVH